MMGIIHHISMYKSIIYSLSLVLGLSCISHAQVVIYPTQGPQAPQGPPPVSQRSKGIVAFDIKKVENQIQDLERNIRYERTGSSPSPALIQSYEQQILLLRQQLVNLNIEYANARP